MWVYLSFLIAIMAVNSAGLPTTKAVYGDSTNSKKLKFVTRSQWGAQPATGSTPLHGPVSMVVIHHSYIPPACTGVECKKAMRSMQDYHQNTRGWADIGYNFAVGSDGVAYEGRGWETVGAHAAGFNTASIGIVLIGDWVSQTPPEPQLLAVKQLIASGVRAGAVTADYILLGHRQLAHTQCPGDALYSTITGWKHFYDQPQVDNQL